MADSGFPLMPAPTSRPHRYLDPAILQKISPLDLAARELVEGIRVGVHKSPLRGFSTEFSQHRPYVPGDTPRHLDWRVYGRTKRYYVKLYEAETNFTAHLLLDASRSMHYGSGVLTKLEYAKYMAASLAHLIVSQRDSVGLAVFDAKLRRYLPPKGSMSIVRTLAEELERVEPEARTNISALLHDFAQRIPRRGFVMLFSDLFDHVDEFLKGLNHLRYCGHNVTVFHLLDPHELEFPFKGTCRFEGLELEPALMTQPQRIRAAYLSELNRFLSRVKGSCQRMQADYVLVNTSRPIEAVLSAYLMERVHSAPGTMMR